MGGGGGACSSFQFRNVSPFPLRGLAYAMVALLHVTDCYILVYPGGVEGSVDEGSFIIKVN